MTWDVCLAILGNSKQFLNRSATSENGSFTTIKPLSTNRWTVRTPAIKAVLIQYEVILAALEELASAKGAVTAPRASGGM